MRSITTEFRYVVRKLARTPLFTVVAALTLAFGIGANSAIFTVVNSVLLKPLPFRDPERLVGLWHRAPGLGYDSVNQSPATYFTYREEGRVFDDVGMWDNIGVSVTGLEEPERLDAMVVTDGTLRLLGIPPVLGRIFSAEDDTPGSPETTILSHSYWQRRMGGDPSVIGRTLTVNGRAREIIGVLPPGLRFLRFDPALYIPFQLKRAEVIMADFSYQGLARLKPGVTVEQANADVERMIPLAVEKFPKGITLSMLRQAHFAAMVRSLKEDAVGDVGKALWVLFGTVGIVLLIACANVANLFLVRADARRREMAVRTALGASWSQMARELLLESVTLGLAGGAVGLGLAYAGIRLLIALGPTSLPRLHEIAIDAPALLFTLAISILAGLLFGAFPLLKLRRSDFAGGLKEGGRGGSEGKERHRARSALVASQIALALVLLVGSGLMIRSFQAMRRVSPGFIRPEEILTFRIYVPPSEAAEPPQSVQMHEQILRRLEAIPGVVSAGLSSSITMDGNDSNDATFVEDFPTPEGQLPPVRRFKWISENYFETMGTPLLAGRLITWADVDNRASVAVVTENFAREYWKEPGAAIGKRIKASMETPWREIVGVVGNEHDDGVDRKAPSVIYWPMLQENMWGRPLFTQRSMAYALRVSRMGSPTLLEEARKAVWSVNPNLPLANVGTVAKIQEASMARTSFTLVMLGIASAVALLLGVVGVYGVISYSVSQRTREIGVRMALGARRADVTLMVLRHGFRLAAVGVAVGLGAASGLTRLMSSLLFGVSPVDPLTYGAVALGLGGMALLASYVPARRAATVDPVDSLRWE